MYVPYFLLAGTELIPSEWTGNFTCPDDNTMTIFFMNITRSDNIETLATVHNLDVDFPMTGSYATIMRILTLQNSGTLLRRGINVNYTDVELDGQVRSAVFIEGFVVFKRANNTLQCPVQLRRTAG